MLGIRFEIISRKKSFFFGLGVDNIEDENEKEYIVEEITESSSDDAMSKVSYDTMKKVENEWIERYIIN